MRRMNQMAFKIAALAALGFTAATASAQMGHFGHGMMHGMRHGAAEHGRGPMMGPVGMLTRQDAGSAADMRLVHELLVNHDRITRTVTDLADGIRTVTESDDPQVAQSIKAHVSSMSERLQTGRDFNIFSTTLPVLFENRDKIRSHVELTEKGAIVTRRSSEAKIVAALQGHASEVTELVQEGMIAMRRGMMTRMAMGPNRFRAPEASRGAPANRTPSEEAGAAR